MTRPYLNQSPSRTLPDRSYVRPTSTTAELISVSTTRQRGEIVSISKQGYFWTREWQEGEREADEDIAEGRTRQFSNVQDAIKWLKEPDEN